jgi:hypothetical protein
MTRFETVIRGGTVVTASDTFEADVGISEGKIQAIGRNLPDGEKTIDAKGRLVLPGGVDGHCHLDQPTGDGPNARPATATATAPVPDGPNAPPAPVLATLPTYLAPGGNLAKICFWICSSVASFDKWMTGAPGIMPCGAPP